MAEVAVARLVLVVVPVVVAAVAAVEVVVAVIAVAVAAAVENVASDLAQHDCAIQRTPRNSMPPWGRRPSRMNCSRACR